MVTDNLSLLSDDDLGTMLRRSWNRAAIAWLEARRPGLSNQVRNILTDEAMGEEEFRHSLQLESLRRIDSKKENPVATVASAPVKKATLRKRAPKKPKFITFLTSRKVARLAEGELVPCEQPKCRGTMSPARTTKIKGKRACRKHYA